ncbi:MAG: hypothetical protein H6662_02875 [Ardenticatenaceae bacterium]|nr:hypothetical protein [Ardenticatenaceae bacterium]
MSLHPGTGPTGGSCSLSQTGHSLLAGANGQTALTSFLAAHDLALAECLREQRHQRRCLHDTPGLLFVPPLPSRTAETLS